MDEIISNGMVDGVFSQIVKLCYIISSKNLGCFWQ